MNNIEKINNIFLTFTFMKNNYKKKIILYIWE